MLLSYDVIYFVLYIYFDYKLHFFTKWLIRNILDEKESQTGIEVYCPNCGKYCDFWETDSFGYCVKCMDKTSSDI